jgi:hypothetical protein
MGNAEPIIAPNAVHLMTRKGTGAPDNSRMTKPRPPLTGP